MIVGASDQMITAGDIQFEPPQKKWWQFTSNIVGLIAGDISAQTSICEAASARFRAKAPGTVKEVADVYADAFTAHRRKMAETRFLVPHGLDANSFVDRQLDMRPELVADLSYHMQNNMRVDAETIIAGSDALGFHIYVVRDPGDVLDMTAVGFAAIGSGGRNAEMQFMLSHYTRRVTYQKALLLTLSAKKRAEVSPGIGKRTDMFFVGDRGFGDLSSDMVDRLTKIHENMEKRIADVTQSADKEARDFVDDFLRNAQSRNDPPAEGGASDQDGPPISKVSEGDAS